MSDILSDKEFQRLRRDDSWKGTHLIRAKAVEGKSCSYPGCIAKLSLDNKSTVCFLHLHSSTCKCSKCKQKAAGIIKTRKKPIRKFVKCPACGKKRLVHVANAKALMGKPCPACQKVIRNAVNV